MGLSRRASLLAVALATALLAACGSQPVAEQSPAAPTQLQPTSAPAPATQAAPTAAPATAAPVTVVPATAAPVTAAPATAAPVTAVVAGGPYADLPQSRTAEGYPLLGDPNAPVTLVMYSDFL